MNLRLVTVFSISALLSLATSSPTQGRLLATFSGISLASAPQETKNQGEKTGKPHFPKVQGAGSLPEKALEKSLGEDPGGRNGNGSKALRGEQILFELREDQEARLFASEKAPTIGVRLAKGDLVWSLPGSVEGSYRQVLVPGGFPGWVYARFVQIDENGKGRTIGRRVSFRYRPETRSYPLTLLPRGARVLALKREGDWWKVIVPSASLAWVKVSALKEKARVPLDPNKIKLSEDLVKRLAAQGERARAPFLAQQAKWKLAQERERGKKQLEEDLLAVQRGFEATKEKADFAELQQTEAALDAIGRKAKELSLEDGGISRRLSLLKDEVSRRKLYLEAKVAIEEATAPKIEGAAPAPRVPKIHPRRRFVETGWIERRPGLGDYSPYRLVKGGRTLYYVTVPGGRYDLEDFVGREVGILGVKVRPGAADFRVLQVDHLVILSGR